MKSAFRNDIQGLRALAVLLVLLFHAGLPFLAGGYVGVDVFFVISGFLITTTLLTEIRITGGISLVRFYARRAKRILPAASVVLVAVGIFTVLFLPRTRWPDTAIQILGSASYAVNWLFANDAVNYLNIDDAPSPVLHFWALAVGEQFYVIWPLLLIVALALSKKKSSRRSNYRLGGEQNRRAGFIVLGVALLVLPSLLWSVYYTHVNPAAAYFVTTTRLWELGVGAVVAVFAVSLARLPTWTRLALGWTGLAAIVGAALLFGPTTAFPGYAALLPTLGTAAIIIGGLNGLSSQGVGRLLSLRPVTWVGDISYSLYLWHWPAIVIGTYLLGTLSLTAGLAIVALSFIPAYLTYRFIERPLLRSPRLSNDHGAALRLGGTLMIATAMMTVAILAIPAPSSAGNVGGGSALASKSGADLLATDPTVGIARDTVGPFLPSAMKAADDYPSIYKDGCHLGEVDSEVRPCSYGDLDSDFVVALVGDSHAAQWLPALSQIALANKWRLEAYTKSSCPFADVTIGSGSRINESCAQWNAGMTAALTGTAKPDLVLTSAYKYSVVENSAVLGAEESVQAMAAGMRRTWELLGASGVNVVSIVDTPVMGINVPECVSENPTSLTQCAVNRDQAFAGVGQTEPIAASSLSTVSVVDIDEYICPETTCAPVIGNVLVWRDSQHITATYSKTLSNVLGSAILATPSYLGSHGE